MRGEQCPHPHTICACLQIGLTDTCGVNNLHGMPALLGATAAGIIGLWQSEEYLHHGSGAQQLAHQFAAIGVTLGIALSGVNQLPSARIPVECQWGDARNCHLTCESGPLSWEFAAIRVMFS